MPKRKNGTTVQKSSTSKAQRRDKSPARKRMPLPESKFFDTTRALSATTTAGAITNASLNIIPEGNGQSDRTGRKVTINSLFVHGTIKVPTTTVAADTSDAVRVIFYQDKQANGATATVANLLAAADFRAFYNLSNKSRFIVLKDVKVALAVQAGSGRGTTDTLSYGENQRWFNVAKTGLNIPIEYDDSATGGELTTQRSNNLGVLVISESAKSSVGYIARVRYMDY